MQQQQQTHIKGSVRHAEKRRNGTCQFANRIARISLDIYEQAVPKSYRDVNKQTCVASIVAHFRNDGAELTTSSSQSNAANRTSTNEVGTDISNDNLQVMGLGVGTKFLSHDILCKEQQLGTATTSDNDKDSYGKRIRDCHAEVLARRAFRRQISLEILSDLQSLSHNNNNQSTALDSKEEGEIKTKYIPILERVQDLESNNIQYRLKSNVTLHFYTSSAPCGNATLKKFTKMEKEKFDESLGSDEWPTQKHTPIAAHSLRLGQFALLVKKDGSIIPPADNTTTDLSSTAKPSKEEDTHKPSQKKPKLWPCRTNDDWCPPSCSITNFNKGSIHSCSDKLCRWNCLGLQGSLLMPMLDKPLYMTTLTVGRKFSRAICQRAVCCRADGFRSGRSDDCTAGSEDIFHLNHPTLMETKVYMDESGTHDMSDVTTLGRDATFDSNLCFIWWPDKVLAECLDGSTGLKTGVEGKVSTGHSDCSTYSLTKLNVEILDTAGVTKSQPTASSNLSLSDMQKLKSISIQYESAKADLLRHRVFKQWSCREC